MALTHVFVNFSSVPTFNEFDTRFRCEWAGLKSKGTNDSYRMWGDEALIPLWVQLACDAVEQGVSLPDATVRCLELMGLDAVVASGDASVLCAEDELYPLPVAVLSP